MLMPRVLPMSLQIAMAALVLLAAYFDIRERRVPNWLALAGFGLGVGLNGALGGFAGLKMALLGAGLALLIYLPLWLLHAMGAGDAKLMAAVGAVVGPASWWSIFFLTVIVGAVIAVIAIVVKRRGRRTLGNLYLMVTSLAHRTAPYKVSPELDVQSSDGFRMPHAVSIACGSFLFQAFSAIAAMRAAAQGGAIPTLY